MTDYPIRMTHPQAAKSVITKVESTYGRPDYHGTPDRFPPVTVNNAMQEANHRAMGYIVQGEAPPPYVYADYPKMLTHPKHVAAVLDEQIPQKDDVSGAINMILIKGKPEVLPPVQVNNPEEEAEWIEKGYELPGKADPDAIQTSISSPYVPGRVTQEFPKMVNGKVIDPNAGNGFAKYPMWLGGTVVNNEREELEQLRKMTSPSMPSGTAMQIEMQPPSPRSRRRGRPRKAEAHAGA